MLKIGQNWGKIANYPSQCLTKIGTTGYTPLHRFTVVRIRVVTFLDRRVMGFLTQKRTKIVFTYNCLLSR